MPLPDWIAPDARLEAGESDGAHWSTDDLARQVDDYSAGMTSEVGALTVVGVIADNSPHWIAIDLAAQASGICLVPLPGFFSGEQMAHAVRASGMQALFCADVARAASLGFVDEAFAGGGLRLFRSRPTVPPSSHIRFDREAQKLTFTSGTTGTPKGVLLSTGQQLVTARALASVTAMHGIKRHLSALPLPILLENVAGVYTALMLGAACIFPSLEEIGLSGASGFDAERCLDAIGHYQPDSLILLPQMLCALVAKLAARRTGDARIRSLKFVPVGGAKTPAPLIERARDLGLPVYEGYGLTECASVVTLNVPGADRAGTVGRPLPGVRLRVAPDGELEIAGRSCIGYVGSGESAPEPWLRSGDLGAIDTEGFVSITGRKKSVLVTSFGRNISPEWPESLLLDSPLLAQAAVFGEGCPYLVAVLVAASPHIDDATLHEVVSQVNLRLPEYARIGRWIRASEPFTARNGLATMNGRIRRDALALWYASRLSALYEEADRPRALHASDKPSPAIKRTR